MHTSLEPGLDSGLHIYQAPKTTTRSVYTGVSQPLVGHSVRADALRVHLDKVF